MKKNSKLLILLAVVFNFCAAFGQYEITLNAFVLDQKTQKPVPYVNIGFINKTIGTVSNKSGRFYLRYDESEIREQDIFQFSTIGYESLQLTEKELFERLEKNNTILLQPKVYDKKEATIFETKAIQDSLGYASYDSGIQSYWSGKNALGTEIATLIKVNKKKTKLHNLKFEIVENKADSVLVRVNIYDEKNKKPNTNILSSAIYHKISRKKGEEIIDLSAYDITVNDDFVVSLELVAVYGKDILFAVKAGRGGSSFLRLASQDRWKEGRNEGVAFKIDTSYPFSDQLQDRQKPNNIVLYWDTSLSMQSRNLEKELAFLQYYVSELNEVRIDVIPFSDVLGKKKRFTINNGNSKDLVQMLIGLKYNGGSNFSELFKENSTPDQYLVFTDGMDTYGGHQFVYDTPVFYINSKKVANNFQLQQGGFSSDGHYLNLSKISPYDALNYISKEIEDTNKYSTTTYKLISGSVYADSIPVQGCKVSVKGTLKETITDRNGNFLIRVNKNQVLSFQHFSMKNKEITYDGSKVINIKLDPKYENLNEVTLKGKKKNPKEDDPYYHVRKKAFGEYVYTKEELPKDVVHLSDLIRRTLFEVNIVGFGLNAEFKSRRFRYENAVLSPYYRRNEDRSRNENVLFVVDDDPLFQPPIFLQPNQIETIYFMSAITASIRYGQRGANGAVVINTKYGFKINNNYVNPLLVKNNDYKESTFLLDPNQNRPEYLNRLWNSSTYSNALEMYYELRKTHMNEVPFYVYCSEYFKLWDTTFSKQIMSNLTEIANDNYMALRTLAFQLEEDGNNKKALLIYEKLYDLRPDYGQSYLDLGRMYKTNKEYEKALDIYKKILESDKGTVEFTEVRKQAESEVRQLFNHHRSHIKNVTVPKEFLSVKGVPARIVFEWNDPQAEFEFQFVTPKKKYEKWAHRFDDNRELLQEEVKYGMMSKEFVVDNSMPGEWVVNIQSYNEVSNSNPTFMKYTLYKNYGLPGETKTVKFIKLYNLQEKVTLDKFII